MRLAAAKSCVVFAIFFLPFLPSRSVWYLSRRGVRAARVQVMFSPGYLNQRLVHERVSGSLSNFRRDKGRPGKARKGVCLRVSINVQLYVWVKSARTSGYVRSSPRHPTQRTNYIPMVHPRCLPRPHTRARRAADVPRHTKQDDRSQAKEVRSGRRRPRRRRGRRRAQRVPPSSHSGASWCGQDHPRGGHGGEVRERAGLC